MGCANFTTTNDLRQMKDSMNHHTPKQKHSSFIRGIGIQEKFETVFPNAGIFGNFAHVVYEAAAFWKFDDSVKEVPVLVTYPDGTRGNGRIDNLIDNKVIIDYKTNDMREWGTSDAKQSAQKYGQQIKRYVEADGVPLGCKGWIISTVPPNSPEVRQVYENTLAQYGVRVKFSTSEKPFNVMKAVEEAVRES
jgi:hypothetical protein